MALRQFRNRKNESQFTRPARIELELLEPRILLSGGAEKWNAVVDPLDEELLAESGSDSLSATKGADLAGDGSSGIVIGPTPPPDRPEGSIDRPPSAGAVFIPHYDSVTDYDWWYGCSPTTGGMHAAWWDYEMQLTDPDYTTFPGDSTNWLFGIYPSSNPADFAVPGHANGVVSGWNHVADGDTSWGHPPDSVGDFMLTMGGGSYDDEIEWGMQNFMAWDDLRTLENESWSVSTSRVYTPTSWWGGTWTFDDYKAEVDAGRPVHLWLMAPGAGHSVLGVGYYEGLGGDEEWIEIYTTWNWGVEEWEWTNETQSGYGFTVDGAMLMDIAHEPLTGLSGYLALEHTSVGQLTVNIGLGDPASPVWETSGWSGGMPGYQNLVLTDIDLSAAEPYLGFVNRWYLEVYDQYGLDEGTIMDFQIRWADERWFTSDIGEPILDFATSYAYVTTIEPVEGIDLVPYNVNIQPQALLGLTEGQLTFGVYNLGDTGFTEDFVLDVYLSDDDQVGGGDDYLIGSTTVTGGMGSLSYLSGSIDLTDLPAADPFGTDGSYYVLFYVDSGDDVDEDIYEDNNTQSIRVTWDRGALFYDDFSTDTGWATDLLGRWERGPAEGGGGQYGNADPDFDATATGDQYLLGYNIGGDYQNAISNTIWVTSPVIDCADFTGLSLRFERWLNVDSPYLPYFDDHVYIEAYDGADWQLVFQNTDRITDSAWQTVEYDVSIHADGNSEFRIRFGMGPTNASQRYSGWNIDDVRLIGTLGEDTIPPQVDAVILPAETTVPITSMEVDFSEGMALYPLTDLANYSLFDETLVMPVPISTVDPGLDYAELQLGTALQIGNTYRLKILSGGLVDNGGNPLDGDPDVMGLEDFEYLFSLPGLSAGEVEPIDAYGGRVTFYDTDLTVPDDVRPAAIIRGNDVVGITQVILLPQYAEFGVVIEQQDGSSQPIAIYDVTSDPYGISYIVADANVSVLSLTSELLGMNLNGAALGANVALPLDIDGDGVTNDPASFVGLGNVGVVVSSLPITGDVVVTGNVNYVGLHGVNASLNGEVTVGGNLGQFRMASGDFDGSLTVGGSLGLLYLGSTTDLTGTLTAGDVGVLIFNGPGGVLDTGGVYSGGDIDLLLSLGPIAADVSAAGHVGRVVAMDGTGLGFSLTAGAGLDLLYSLGDVLGDVDVTGNAGVLKVIDGDVDGDLTVSGNLNVVQVIRGSVTDDVINVGGNLNLLYVYNPGMLALADDVTVGGNLGVVRAYGDIGGSIAAGGSGGSVVAFGDVTGAMSFGSGLGLFYASGDFNGDLNVNGNLSRVLIRGNVTDSLVNVTGGNLTQFALLGDLVRTSVNVEGALYSTLVGWNYTDSSINAGRLGRVTVGGTISSTGADYEINAQMGRFDLFVRGAYYGIDLSHDELFAADRVRAWVGLT